VKFVLLGVTILHGSYFKEFVFIVLKITTALDVAAPVSN
jgi:hypothetical protein